MKPTKSRSHVSNLGKDFLAGQTFQNSLDKLIRNKELL